MQGIFAFLSMQHIEGIARSQISFGLLEDHISVDNPMRFVDVFATKLDATKNNMADVLVCCL